MYIKVVRLAAGGPAQTLWAYMVRDDEPPDILKSRMGRRIRELQEAKGTDLLSRSDLLSIVQETGEAARPAPEYDLQDREDGTLAVCDSEREVTLMVQALLDMLHNEDSCLVQIVT